MGKNAESGLALPAALLGLFILTALATAGVFGSLVERRIAEAHAWGVRAFEAARAGLENAMGQGLDPADLPQILELPDGDSAVVDAVRLLALEGGDVLYLVRADGSAGAAARGRARRLLGAVVLVTATDSAALSPDTWELPGSRFELFPP